MSTVGAYAVERDYSHYVAYASKTILAVVGTASKGPIGEAVAVTSSQDLVNKFGSLRTDCLGLYAGQYFLSQASKLYFVRAAGKSAASSKASISGVNASDSEVDSIKLEFIEKGTFSNNYTVTVTPVESTDKYTLVLKTDKGTTIETIKEVTFDDLSVGYQSGYLKVTEVDPQTASLVSGTYTFSGGNNGTSDITSGDYIAAANTLAADSVDINLIAVPGVTEAAVITAVLSLAETRGDCLYLVDTPQGLTRDGVIEWVNGSGSYEHAAFNSSYGAVYYDWVTIYDSINKTNVVVPPSVVACATYAYSDRTTDLWYAPAGLQRGLIRGALNTVTPLNKSDIELLYESNINAIYDDPQVGLVLWGQKTLYRENTALNRINVRRLMNYLKKVITGACNYLVFEPNDRVTWNSFEMKVIPTLNSIKNRRGIYEYKVVKGETIVTDEDIDNYRMPCMILIRPVKAAEEIPIYFVITSTGADFNEVLESNGIIID